MCMLTCLSFLNYFSFWGGKVQVHIQRWYLGNSCGTRACAFTEQYALGASELVKFSKANPTKFLHFATWPGHAAVLTLSLTLAVSPVKLQNF